MVDVLVAGAGPAGAIAAWRLARAGVRVMLVDREKFPRHKLCGDTLNPGAVALLRSLRLPNDPLDSALPLAGMLVTGPQARVEARYGSGIVGRAIERRALDQWLLSEAIAAGAEFEEGVTVREALVDASGAGTIVRGARVAIKGSSGNRIDLHARMTLAADGRASVLARSVGLATYSPSPRRWAFGTYASGVSGTTDVGEMHIRGRKYIGVAPIASDLCNVCVVTGPRPPARSPLDVVRNEIQADPMLRDRFSRARFESPVTVLGPLAVNASACGTDGLLLAGDAAGFIDPMTGDGLHLALRGALLAAEEIAGVLASGDSESAPARLEAARRAALSGKLRFNRALRRLVETPAAVDAAGWVAQLAPAAVRWAVRYAGDAA
jgi:flavin-dependent dehydrogenase